MTKTQIIIAYDRSIGTDLEGIAYYLAGASDAERARYLAHNPRIATAIKALI